MTDPESVYRVKPELPLFASSSPVSGNGAEGGDSALKVPVPREAVSDKFAPRLRHSRNSAQCSGTANTAGNGLEANEGPTQRQSHTEQAPTRRGMPETSYKAAASVVNLGRTRDAILHLLRMHGPMTDEHIWARYLNTKHYREDYPNVSPSGLRSRRSELVKLGLVCDSGQRAKTQSGRESIVWRVK